MTARLVYAAIAAALVLADYASKQWAYGRLRTGPDIEVIPGLLSFVYAENPGIAFSLFNSGSSTTRWLLVGFSLATAIAVAVAALRTPASDWRSQTICALLFAGIAGNLIDRVQTGRVIDFIDAYVGTSHWPTFNVADSAISVGAVLLALELFRKPEPAEADVKSGNESAQNS